MSPALLNRRSSWYRWSVVAALIVVLAWVVPDAGALAALLFWVVGIVVISRARRPLASLGARRALGFIALAGVLAVASNIVRAVHGAIIGQEFPLPSPADLLTLPAYACFIIGEVLFVRYRSAGRDLDSWLNAALASVSIGLILWVGFMSQYVTDPAHPLGERVLNGVYYCVQIVLLTTTVRLLSAPGIRTGSYYLFAGGAAVFVLADLVGSLAFAIGIDPFRVVITNTVAWGLLIGTARHPDVEQLTAVPDDIEPREEGRLWPLSLLTLLLPPALLVLPAELSPARRIEAVIGCVLLVALLAARTLRLVRSRAVLLGRASELVRVADELKGRSSEEIDDLLGDAGRRVLRATPGFIGPVTVVDGEVAPATAAAPALATATAAATATATASAAGGQLPGGQPIDRPEESQALLTLLRNAGGEEVRGRVDAGRVFAVPAPHDDERWIVVISDAVLDRNDRLAVRSLVRSWSAAHVATESAALAAAHLAERQWTKALVESEKRQRALLENSASITAILAEDQSILYVSQPIASILGLAPTAAVGTLMTELLGDGESATKWRQAWERCLATGAATEELRLRHRDGDRRIFEIVLKDHRESDLMHGVVVNARDISETRKLEEQVDRDEVTMALNRRAFISFLRDQPCDVVAVTVNEWRLLSRAASTEEADLVLLTIADRLRQLVRTTDRVARLDGATFAIGLSAEPALDVDDVVSRLRETLGEPVVVDGRSVSLDAVFGYAPNEASATELLEHALLALAEAVSSQAKFETYRSTTAMAFELELDMWTRIEAALEAGEFELHYQPIVTLQSAAVKGVEALIRWRHPERGMVPPNDFIPIAEQHPVLMNKLGDWTIDAAAAQAATWLEQGLVDEDFSISVNVSGAQIAAPLVTTFAEAVARHRIPASMLHIEATETLLSENPNLEADVLAELRLAGHRLAVDDFGTGSSNLAKLQNLRPDIVKLDRSLTSSIETADGLHLFQKSVEVAQAMGAQVTVEGVETIDQATAVRELGCDFAQGFFFARPAPPSERTLSISVSSL